MHRLTQPISRSAILFLLIFSAAIFPSNACTVFVLTNGKHTYFFNNEDFTNPNTRIWFIPKGKGYYGAAYVGYDRDVQGGVNTEGLAFDWVIRAQKSRGMGSGKPKMKLI